MGVIIYGFNVGISPKMSYGVLECDIVVLQNYMLMIFCKKIDFVIEEGCYLCQTLYISLKKQQLPQLLYVSSM